MKKAEGFILGIKKYKFLFEELVKRDFKKKYKRTVLGMVWSVLSPLLTLVVMKVVFTGFFGRTIEYYTTYLFIGNIVFSYFNMSTNQGMMALASNAGIFSKVNVPKYLFVIANNISSLFNFLLTLIVLFLFAAFDGIHFGWHFFMLLYPIICLIMLNVGVSLILSAAFIFFRDTQYLYSVFTLMLMYLSAIFYDVSTFSARYQNLFLLNPVYDVIKYFRLIMIDGSIPSIQFHVIVAIAGIVPLLLGFHMYKKYDQKFMYYV